LRRLVLPWLRLTPIGTPPSDDLGHQVAQLVQRRGADRDRLTAGIHIPTDPKQALGRLERAFDLTHQAQAVLTKIKAASQAGQLPQGKPQDLLDLAYEQGVISEAETTLICEATFARNDAIQVDAFSLEEYSHLGRRNPSNVSVAKAPV
jgi:acyl-CoA dehydrogenase